ncbi:imidazole glycerol phosphate synthase subunit HisH [Sediminibacterium salmoneum]|uniref:imidazole glycerol phosphate synthase subunit HisH n=1 Tax=Sediminibacterium salmoneum TaxID=426421 RepID=UPI00047BBE42|nr:imidazole glycerol phosphate synthase subunit HisH [Sediminibacterium salmoneum]
MITIIDYGMGNLGSVANMFKRIGVESIISSDIDVISQASKILLPGVGAFDTAMEKINELGLIPILNFKALEEKIPIMGICLGMQLLTESSEEGKLKGLGWIPGHVKKFSFEDDKLGLKVPHMGWNFIRSNKISNLTKDLPEPSKFYFVHSYYVECQNRENVIATTEYGFEFDSLISFENIYGAQFHPEKSHKFGMKLLQNFAAI